MGSQEDCNQSNDAQPVAEDNKKKKEVETADIITSLSASNNGEMSLNYEDSSKTTGIKFEPVDLDMEKRQYQMAKEHENVDESKEFDREQNIIAEMIYDSLITSLCVEVASGMHRFAKTGMYPMAELMKGDIDDNISMRGDHRRKKKQKREMNGESHITSDVSTLSERLSQNQTNANENNTSASSYNENGVDASYETQQQHMLSSSMETINVPAPVMSTRKSKGNNVDIWGNIPTKEPKKKSVKCLLCCRMVSIVRFAVHLDKCMGLG